MCVREWISFLNQPELEALSFLPKAWASGIINNIKLLAKYEKLVLPFRQIVPGAMPYEKVGSCQITPLWGIEKSAIYP
jgi:hypothetical protein